MEQKTGKVKALLFVALAIIVFFVVLTIGQCIILIPAMVKAAIEEGLTDGASLMEYMYQKEGVMANAQFVGEVLSVTVMAIWYYFGFVKKEKKAGTYEPVVKKFSDKFNILFALLLFLAGTSLVYVLYWIMGLVIPSEVENLSNMIGGMDDNALGLIAVVIGAPLSEELTLRGVAMKKTKQAFGIIGCMIMSCICFGVVHGNIVQGIYTIPLGLIFGYVAYKFNSVIPTIFGHALHNGLGGYVYDKIGVAGMAVILVVSCVGLFLVIPKAQICEKSKKDPKIDLEKEL
ncbi:CPBP family intramembrane glutamic endopeptidase [Butyrivibrio sp. LB2008]|uniref:CPBP family intramembrane glutamic endopeptidase n=1 Tax=Butyrivibrio sp. LB2008 TaxID=1408305 RepID=UPI00047CD5E1|nr:type II CAAX endopeptidase family protein [Butyrivibrio sp. LB2008]